MRDQRIVEGAMAALGTDLTAPGKPRHGGANQRPALIRIVQQDRNDLIDADLIVLGMPAPRRLSGTPLRRAE